MGSIDTTLSVKLDALRSKDFPDVSTETTVETIWAITHFVYTGDNEVNFTCYSSTGIDRATRNQPLSSVRSYSIDEDAKPVDIAKTGCGIEGESIQTEDLELDTSVPGFTQFIRQTALLIEDDTGSGLMYEIEKHKPYSMLFCVSVQSGHIQGTILPNTSKHNNYYEDIVDTIERVAEMIVGEWNVPLSQTNFLSLGKWRNIPCTASMMAKINGYRSGDTEIRSAGGTGLYLGHVDTDVKTRGHGVELGEIEHTKYRTQEEQLLRRLWAQVLQVPENSLSADDNFFQVGGDSIKAIELVAALRQHGRVLRVAQVLQNPEMSEAAQLLGYVDYTASEEPPQPFELLPDSIDKAKCVQEAAGVCQISADMVEDVYPTTPMQEALMAISAHRSNAYVRRMVFKIPESLDLARFKKAWGILMAAQAIYRTRIVTLYGAGTVQVVLRSTLEWQTDMTLDELVRYDQETPFSYGSALSRYAIVYDDKDALYFVWSGHHAISDGWSLPLMFDEIRHIYHHGSTRPQAPYTPFIGYLHNLNLEESDQFWKEQFPDTVEVFPRLSKPDHKPHAGQMQTLNVKIDRNATSKTTTATLIQSAWALVTATYANTDEAVFGLTLSGRDAPVPEITNTMGITITTVPVRVVFDNTSTISEYLEEVSQYMSQVKQHQHVGLQRIYHLSPETRAAATFQNLLVIQPANDDRSHQGLSDLGLQLVKREENDTSDYALTVLCAIGDGGGLQVKAHYDDKVLSDKQVECLLHLFEHIIKQLATESTSRSLHELDRLSPHDLDLLMTWNAQMPHAVEKTLHALFEERARATPNAMALDGYGGRLTYAELNRSSTQLASYLQRHAGIGPESRVMLCFTKSNLPIVAMLATLKSGGVCVSINPEHPTARLLALSDEVDSKVVLCDEESVDRFKDCIPHVIGVTGPLLAELKSAPVDQLPPVLPTNASFIVYSSGSTGRPKGSVLNHLSLATHLTAVGDRVKINARSRTLQFSSYTFDCHILEIFGTLLHGGCVCVISDHERMNFLCETINERQVNFAVLTRTVSRLLEPERLPTLQTLILTGEQNSRQDYWRWAGYLKLFNGLGPSECTPLVCLTRGRVGTEDDPANIGHAMACHLWVTDHRRPHRLVPIGCVGELTVEGPIVGRGYANRAKETAAAFINNPAWSQDGSGRSRRFYRSGDLAKMNVDGSITFIGRVDSQVKIHGQRVELGEIEDHLRRCNPAFTTSAADTFKTSSRGGATVLAVLCSRGSERRSKLESADKENSILPMDEETRSVFKEAQAKLSQVLPQYMVPSLFIPVEYLPFNASGKLERKKLHDWVAALDANDLGQYYLASSIVSRAPETDKEKRMQALWASVLNVAMNTIHAEDNFFRLGGDSVLSMKLIADARAQGISMTVADVFRVPLLKDMALAMVEPDSSQGQENHKSAAIEPMSLIKNKVELETCIKEVAQDCGVTADLIEDIYPCIPTQEALMAVSSHRPRAYTYQVILKIPRSMNLNRFKLAWEKLVAAQAIFRTRIVFQRGVGSLQVTLRSNITWQTITGLSLEQYLQREGALFVEYGSELCKFAILQHGDDDFTFVGTLHHALYDGWSLLRTYKEFSCIYQTGAVQTSIVPYSTFFHYLSGVDAADSDEFWRREFPTITKSYPQLPSAHYVARPRHSKSSDFRFSRKPDSEVTAATVVQTAWAILMSKYSQSEDVVFGLMLSGRDVPVDGITDIIGPTIATVPLRVDLDQGMTISHHLDSMQKKTANIKKHQHTGLQRISRLSPESSAAVKFRNLLVVHTMGDAEITSPLSALGLHASKATAVEFLDIALTVDCTIRQDNLQVHINYDQCIVPHRQVEFMLYQMKQIALILFEESGMTKLREMNLASPYGIDELNTGSSNVSEPLREQSHCHEYQSRASPDGIAAWDLDEELTYRELDTTADPLGTINHGQEKFSEGVAVDSISTSPSSTVKQQPTNSTEATLQLVWSQILNHNLSDVGISDTFMSLGGDSITAMQVVSESRRHGIKLRVSTILTKRTILDIAPHCIINPSIECNPILPATGGTLFDLSPIQKLYFEQEFQQWTHYNQSFLCRVKQGVSAKEVQRAFDIVVDRHAMLRARFSLADGGRKWMQHTAPAETEAYRFKSHNLAHIDSGRQDDMTACVTACTRQSLSTMDITTGPVFSVDFFNVAGDDAMVYLVAHHLVIDLVSWRIIWRDLEEIIRKGSLPSDVSPPFTFQNWVALQEQKFKNTQVSADTVYPSSMEPASNFNYWGVFPQDNTLENSTKYSFSLSPELSNLVLGKCNQAMRTTPLDILVGLFVQSFQRVFHDRQVPPVFIEHHGREPCDGADDVDLSQTVGWFTTMYPVHVPLTPTTKPYEAIRLAKDARHLIPKNGHPYFAFRHLSPDGTTFAHHTPVEILVNFQGIFQQLETRDGLIKLEARVPILEPESDPKSHRFAMIDLGVEVSHGVMEFSFTMHKNIAYRDRVQEWISLFRDSLVQSLPGLATEAPTCTLSDFPRLKLTYEDLQDLLTNRLPQFGLELEHGLIEDMYPCTTMQEGILLSQQTDSQLYLGQRIWKFTDDPLFNHDLPSRLAQAWKSVVRRHLSLRTGIVEHATDNSHFIQVVLKDLPSSRFVEVKEVIDDASEIPDIPELEEDSFWMHVPRLVIYHTKHGETACSLKVSHVLIDGISLDLLMKELISLLAGQVLPSAAMDFGKYVEYEQNIDVDQNLAYWTELLKDVQPCHIPTQNMQAVANAQQDYAYIQLPEDMTEGLQEFCQRLNITQAILLQTAWAIVLGAFTGQDDVCFGYLASGRDAPLEGIESSAGLFISMQVCRVHLRGIVKDLVQGVHGDVVAGLEHRNCSLALIQSMLGLKSMPLFNTSIAIRRAFNDEEKSKMYGLVNVLQGAEKTEFAITLGASVGSTTADIGMTYQKSKITSEYASSIAGSYETVVRCLLKAEDQPVHAVEVIGKGDRTLVDQWNSTPEVVYATLHGLVEEQVRANPHAIATSGYNDEYTYAQLNSMADKLAALMNRLGVRPEVRVVICFAKSTWPIVSMLAVLKAGGVCVATNADHPTNRQLEICADVETPVVLCDKRNSARFQGHVSHVITVDEDLFSKLHIPIDWARPVVKPNNAAFVVFTSGSSGKPKGCVLEHNSVAKSQLVNVQAMNITPTTRAVQFASYSFDASICEIFAPLVAGACVCVVSDDERLDDLAAAINARKADWIMLTPTVARLFSPSAVPTLKTLVFGGEALSREALSREALEIWSGHVHLVNYWGPSECSNSGCINTNITKDTNPMNIGRPSGCNIWITEQKNPHRLAPIGCAGELVVEGPMLGREYINRPDATAASFVKDLAWSIGRCGCTRRFYRTGDLARYNPDGSITFVGRADNQVKIHGQRVELDEIKHRIAANLPIGSEVVVDVVSVGGRSKKPSLAAFIKLEVFSQDTEATSNLEVKDTEHLRIFQTAIKELQRPLAEALPQYMIPTAYIPIGKIPTTPSAKTDRKLLRELAHSFTRETASTREVDQNKNQPTNDMERDLQTVWAHVLNHRVSNIGIHDTFMSHGGDSMTAMRVASQCRNIGIKTPVSVILQKKTIAAIAPHCTRMSTEPIQLNNIKTADGMPFSVSPIQKQYFDQESSQGWVQYNQSFLVRIKQRISAHQLKRAFDLIVNRHSMLRARFSQQSNGRWQQLTMPHGNNLYRFLPHCLAEVDEEVITRQAEKSAAILDIVKGPVFSVDFFDLSNQDGMAFMVAHHLVIDIVSWQVILHDLEEIIQSGEPLSLPSTTFQGWCSVQEAETKTKVTAEEVFPLSVPPSNFQYWKVSMRDNIFGNVIHKSFELPAGTTDLVLNQSNQAMGTTPLEVVLGPLLSSFNQIFLDRDVPTVFIEHHGREPSGGDDVELSQVVGWFTSTYPVHVPIDQNTTATEAVRLVKDLRRKVPRNGQPYFAYRHLTTDGAEKFAHHAPVELVVNFTGMFQQLEVSDNLIQLESRIKSSIPDADLGAHRWAMIDVGISVSRGVMTVDFQLNKRMAHLHRVRRWIAKYQDDLSQTAKVLALQRPTYTLSDFPLLDTNYCQLDDLSCKVLPTLGIKSMDSVEDILPLSPFQKYSIEAHLDDPPRQWQCFWFQLPKDVDVSKLRQACIKVVEHHSTLRTLFTRHDSGFLQVVLKSLDPQIDSYESEEDIAAFMERVFHQDLARLPPLGRPFLRFFIIRTPTHARLLMRLSHAQIDGFSRTSLVKTLAALYSDQRPPESIGYSKFVHHIKHHHQEGCRYWRSILAGAEPTTVIKISTPPSFTDNGVIRSEKIVPPFRALDGVTAATIFNAACALLVRSLTNSIDITFGRITSGRAGLDHQFQNLVGPCVNIIPVRVRFKEGLRQADILQLIHKQYVESIPYETVGLDNIIRDCTDWSTSMAKFPVVTQYFNQEDESEAQVSGGAKFDVHVWDPVDVDPYPWSLGLGAFPSRAGVKISIAANSKYAERAMVEQVLDGLCAVIDCITQNRGP